MSSSANSLLMELWPELKIGSYTSKEFELSPTEKNIITAVFTERKCICALCGRADNNDLEFMFTGIRKTPLTVHAFCPCGYRIGLVTRASLKRVVREKKPLQVTLDDFLAMAEKNNPSTTK